MVLFALLLNKKKGYADRKAGIEKLVSETKLLGSLEHILELIHGWT
jgi:hypothetical protein